MEKTFNEIFKNDGGIFTPSNFMISYHKIWLQYCKHIVDFLTINHDKLPKPYINIIDNPNIGAKTAKKEGTYFIGINIEIFSVLHFLYCRMMSSKHIFPQFGDVESLVICLK